MKFYQLWIALHLLTGCLVIHHVECEEAKKDKPWHSAKKAKPWYSNLSILVHHNGKVDPCGSTLKGSVNAEFIKDLATSTNKYEMETRLTDGLASLLLNAESACGVGSDDESSRSFYSHCDRGPEKTPILLDHEELVNTAVDTLPCRFHTREGLRIQSLDQLKAMAQKAGPSQLCVNPGENCDATEIHLYAVPAGRLFHFAPAFVGEVFKLDHLTNTLDASKPISLKVLSTNPRVFDIINVFDSEEADAVVKRALAETSPTYKLKRSTTAGVVDGGHVYDKRTSENGFDTSGAVATAMKKRIFELLGFDEYWHSHTDGLQVLRYNLTTAYVPHYDYIEPQKSDDFDLDSAGVGGNRFATVLLYMTDIPENAGGETVFRKIWPENGKRQLHGDALRQLRETGDADRAGIKRDSWEEEMVADCRRHFSVKPYTGRAVLFYSQHPNGEEDKMSLHGGCPVLEGDKWAANLWVWNTPRKGNKGAPMKEGAEEVRISNQIHALFRNSGKDESMKDAELYYDEAMFWGKLIPGGEALGSNTYEGHRWNVKVDGNVVKTFTIGKDPEQEFII